jgi:microcystin-dependent protein
MKAQQIGILLAGFGTALSAGKVYAYESGTTTAKAVYTDKDMGTEDDNPLTLDANGRVLTFGYGWYKLLVKYADGTTYDTIDGVYYGVYELDEDLTVRAITESDNIETTDEFIEANASSGAIIATLPDVTGLSNNERFSIKKMDATANTVTLKGNGSQLIDGSNTKVLSRQYNTITVVANSDLTAWDIETSTDADTVDGAHASVTPTADYIPIADENHLLDDDWINFNGYIPHGIIFPYGGSSAPTGFLECDGSAVSRETYADLFTATSTTYGTGDGSTTFNVPDLRGRCPIGEGQLTPPIWKVATAYTAGYYVKATASYNYTYECTTAGTSHASTEPTWPTSVGNTVSDGTATWTCRAKWSSYTAGQIVGEQTHTLTTAELAAHTHTSTSPSESSAVFSLHNHGDAAYTLGDVATSSAGGGGAHNNMMPCLTVGMWIIKT